jgi:hypothetical protein
VGKESFRSLNDKDLEELVESADVDADMRKSLSGLKHSRESEFCFRRKMFFYENDRFGFSEEA